MARLKLLFTVLTVVLFLWIMATAVLAQEEIPSPYAGQENPIPWDDESAISAGQELYKNSCLGCHGLDGANLDGSDFSAADYPSKLEDRPDFYFWILSDGALDRGMPGYKSSFSDEQRWQLLAYLRTLAQEANPEVVPEPAETAEPIAEEPAGEAEAVEEVGENTLQIIVPEQIASGQSVLAAAYLWDGNEEPVADASVKFFVRVDFFATGELDIGETRTDEDGIAVIEYAPRQMGDLEIIARYEEVEAVTTLAVTSGESFYETEVGLHLSAVGPEVFIGPESASQLVPGGNAPTSAFRLPGGIISWLLLVVAGVVLIWATYFYVMRQVLGIPIRQEIRDTDTRLVPFVGMAVILSVAFVLLMMLVTGPYSQFHLFG
jgi:mono/diheme cytochrome c family protein